MKKITTVALLLILSFILVSIPQIEIVRAESTIYIRADGSVEGTAKIQRDGDIYTFTDDVFYSIVVEKDDIMIDGVGYSLQGEGSGCGIYISDRGNMIVKNMQIDNFLYGVYVDNSSNIIVTGNSITNNTYGIDLVSPSRNDSISRNYIANNEVFGLRLYGCPDNDILENNITNNKKTAFCCIFQIITLFLKTT
jgi:parallel beta-helix repeat protein